MFHPTRSPKSAKLCDLLLRDIASLLVTSELTSSSLAALRPECEFSRDLLETLDCIVATSEAGESHLHDPLAAAGAVLPPADTTASAVVMDFFMRLPAANHAAARAAEIAVNLRLLAQHIELKARLAAEEALIVGQNRLCQALITWAAEWRACGETLRIATVRAQAQTYVTPELNEFALASAG